jgi:uroporphyrinogen-III synthase
MRRPLEGRTVALAEGRQLEELARMLEAEGAAVLRCPLLSILDAPDPGPVVDWIRDLCAGRFDLLVLMTGEAVRRLLSVAEREGLRDDFLAALGRTRTLSRGPKPGQALKPLGLVPSKVAVAPTTDGVIATLREESLTGKTVGVTLSGAPNPALEEFLTGAGAAVRTALAYVYAPAAGADRVADLITHMAAGQVDAVVFTSSPQVDRLFEVARERGLEPVLSEGLGRTKVAAVGPVVAETLQGRGVRADICPRQGWQMKNLVQHVKRALGPA